MTKAAELAKMGEVLTNSQIGGRRNIVINGAMQVAQRSTSETVGASTGYFTLDRFKVSATTDGRATMSQDSDAPNGFGNSLKFQCTTADTSISANDIFSLNTRFEGQDLQRFKKGTSDAEKMTISFYVKANASATYVFELYDIDNARQISQSFSVTTSWNRVILTFDGDTTGAFGDDNGSSLIAQIWLHGGSSYTSGTLSTSWSSVTNANRAVGISSFFDSTDRTFFITGLQMEVGEQATPFEHRSFGEELRLCQRYFYRIGDGASRTGFATTAGHTSSAGFGIMHYPVTMRATPTVTKDGADSDYYLTGDNGQRNITSLGTEGANKDGVTFTVGASITQGKAYWFNNANTNGTISFDSEL